jgi:hypothetical protein
MVTRWSVPLGKSKESAMNKSLLIVCAVVPVLVFTTVPGNGGKVSAWAANDAPQL